MKHPSPSSCLRALSCVVLLTACGGSGDTTDSGTGTPDAFVPVDAFAEVDAGQDAGPPWTPPTDCTATGVDVYTPPPNVPAFTMADRGRVLTCGQGDALDAATIDARARERDYAGEPLTHGATVTQVLYQSERKSGEAGYASGALYLPADGATALPLVVYVSGTTGIGDPCAPSDLSRRYEDFERAFYVLVGTGHAVFVPDLVGLGTPGTMAWLEPNDAGHSVLDGARAALDVAPDGALSGQVLLAGHSAGGHAVMAAQSFQRTYAPELDVLGVSGLASAWLDTTSFGLLLYFPDYATTDPDSGWNVVYGGYYYVGHTAAYDGEAHAYEPIAEGLRDQVRAIFEGLCFSNPGGEDLRAELAAIAPDVGTLFDPAFRQSVSDCYLGIACDERGQTWVDRFAQDRPALDPDGAQVWFHHGDADPRVTLASVVCPYHEAITADPRTTACIYAGVDHNHLPGVVAPWLVQWVDALAAGSAAPACPETTPLPDCTAP